MKGTRETSSRLPAICLGLLIVAAVMVLMPPETPANTITWTNNKSEDWDEKNNWTPKGVPANLDDVVLTGAGNTNNKHPTNQDIAGLNLKSLTFDDTATEAYVVSGNAITLTPTAGGTGLRVDASSADHGIGLDITLGSNQAWDIDAGRVFTMSGIIGGTGRSLTKTGTGTLLLTDANSYSGGTTVSAGTVRGNSTSLQGDILNNAALVFDQNFHGTYAGAISGTGTLEKAGTGKLTLTRTNTYSGTTTITGGRLHVKGSIANSNVIIQSGGRLIGSGTVKNVTIATGGIIAPGDSPGTTTTANETWEGGGIYEWEIDDVDAGKGTNDGWDWLDASGTINIAATSGNKFIIDITSLKRDDDTAGPVHDFVNTQTYSWVIATAAGGINGFSADKFDLRTTKFENSLGAGYFEISQNGNDIVLSFVPEPASVSVLVIGAALLLVRTRRRRRV